MSDEQAKTTPESPPAPVSKRAQKRGAEIRIKELLATLNAEKQKHEQEKKVLESDLDKLRADLQGQEDARVAAEQRVWDMERAAAQRREEAEAKEKEDRLLAMKALIDVAERTGVRHRHREWDARVERAAPKMSTRLLKELLDMVRVVGANPAELALELSADLNLCGHLSALTIAPDGAGIGEIVRSLCFLAAQMQPREAFLAATRGT